MNQLRALLDLDGLTVQMTTVHSNRPGGPSRYWMIRITDEASGQLIVEANVQAVDLIDLMSGSSAKAAGRVNANHHRFGKTHHYDQIRIDGIAEHRSAPDHPNVQAARQEALDAGWEVADYQCSRGHHFLIVRAWR